MKSRVFSLLLILVLSSACAFPGNPAPTTPALNGTQVYQTVQVRLTEAIALTQQTQALPTQTLTPTPPPPTATPRPAGTATATALPATPTPTTQCDQAAPGNPIDVTIPDDSEMYPGQTFVKTWRLVNTGTCTWTPDYTAVWFSGEQMGEEVSVALPGNVAPGESVDISVQMTAPQQPGTYQSNWKLRNAAGVLFGLGPGDGLFFYVRIKVVVMDTPTSTLLPTKTPQPTTAPQAAGPATLTLSDTLDLDANARNPAAGADLLLGQDTSLNPVFLPQNGAQIALWGGVAPSSEECQQSALATTPLRVDTMLVGTYVCYRTDAGRIGWLRLNGYLPDSQTVNLAIYTWP
ncbi:MAG: hypothetical protein D6755_06955 [Anaerolineae bacterium]|nr:MAG: hypothetical protein D6755_06955 [Anaerolineae bacterium]